MSSPQFPDYTNNYQKTVAIPAQKAQEAAEAARQAELAKQAALQAQASYTAPITATGNCSGWMAQAGISDPQSAYTLIMRESGCNPNSVNASSGACGIGQQLPCGKWAHTWNDPVGGMMDMQVYVYNTYGTWANALSHSYAYNWY